MPAWLGSMFFKALIEWVAGKISGLIARYKKQQLNKKEAEANAEADTEKLKQVTPDSTEEKTNEAIDDVSKRF